MDKNSFILAVLNSPSLSPKDKERVINLIIRDIGNDLVSSICKMIRNEFKSDDKITTEVPPSSSYKWEHNPRAVCDFLKNFKNEESFLRYSVHRWGTNEFTDYDDFISKIRGELNRLNFNGLYKYNIGLYYTLKNFLLTDYIDVENSFSWGNENILIGLRYPPGAIQKWMLENPDQPMMAMPISAFPENNQVKYAVDNKIPSSMEDICEIFKNKIEFRGKSFEQMIKKAFNNSDYHPVYDDSIRGHNFYTYTPAVKDFLESIVAQNIKSRIAESSTDVNIYAIKGTDNTLELHILHKKSYPDTDINNEKLKSGTMACWRNFRRYSLMSICDFAIEGRFIDKDQTPKAYRIEYLYPYAKGNDNGPSVIMTPLQKELEGFEYILKFYL